MDKRVYGLDLPDEITRENEKITKDKTEQKQVILDGTHEENMKALMEFLGWSEEDEEQ